MRGNGRGLAVGWGARGSRTVGLVALKETQIGGTAEEFVTGTTRLEAAARKLKERENGAGTIFLPA